MLIVQLNELLFLMHNFWIVCPSIQCNRPNSFLPDWGRKNGDVSRCDKWPLVCTYKGMDSLLQINYTMMAKRYNSILSPVGSVWKYIRENYPSIELYNSDESHPSEAGSYAAACCFYTLFYKNSSNVDCI